MYGAKERKISSFFVQVKGQPANLHSIVRRKDLDRSQSLEVMGPSWVRFPTPRILLDRVYDCNGLWYIAEGSQILHKFADKAQAKQYGPQMGNGRGRVKGIIQGA